MALFQNPFKAAAPAPPAAPTAPAPPAAPKAPAMPKAPTTPLQVPAHLPKITAPTAAQIAKTSEPAPAAKALLTPQQTPSQYLTALKDKQMGDEMVKTLAHGMPDREGVWWASKSAEHVADKLPAHDVQAMHAAQAWVKNPTPATQAAAAAAASKTNLQGPGGLAAQGAAWAQPAGPASGTGAAAPAIHPTAPAAHATAPTPGTSAPGVGAAAPGAPTVAMPRMTPHAVSASVLMSSAIKANPSVAVPKVAAPSLTAPKMAMPQVAMPQPAAPATPPPTVPPNVQNQTFQQQHPFISMGLDIASGKHGWA